jgi:hypothetical protein
MPPAPHLHARAHHHICAQGADGACVQHRIGRVELWRMSLGARNTRGVAVSKVRPGRGASLATLLLCLGTLLFSHTHPLSHTAGRPQDLLAALLLCLVTLFLCFSVPCSLSHTHPLSHTAGRPHGRSATLYSAWPHCVLCLWFSIPCSLSHTHLLSLLRRAPLIIRVLISMGRSNRWHLTNHTNLTATLYRSCVKTCSFRPNQMGVVLNAV